MNVRSQTGLAIDSRVRLFQVVVGMLSVAAISVALAAVVRGAAARNAGSAVAPGLDHQYRYQAGAYLAVGLLALGTTLNVRRWGHYVKVVVAVVFVGGLARVVSIVDVGVASNIQYALVALECIVVPGVLVWHRRIDPVRDAHR